MLSIGHMLGSTPHLRGSSSSCLDGVCVSTLASMCRYTHTPFMFISFLLRWTSYEHILKSSKCIYFLLQKPSSRAHNFNSPFLLHMYIKIVQRKKKAITLFISNCPGCMTRDLCGAQEESEVR